MQIRFFSSITNQPSSFATQIVMDCASAGIADFFRMICCISPGASFFFCLLYTSLSAISSISTEIFESAEIDGANGIQSALYITLPLIKNTMLVCITLCIAGNMKAFDNIYVMTKGGPGTSSMVMAMYGYQVSFNQSNMGYGSCISVGIFVLSLLVIGGAQGLIKRLTREKEA